AGHPRACRATGAVPPRRVSARADTRAAAGDRADREEASAARADGCAAPVRGGRGSTHNVRVRDARRIQRRTRARTRPGHADPRVPLAREPDSLQPDPGPGLEDVEARRDAALPASPGG